MGGYTLQHCSSERRFTRPDLAGEKYETALSIKAIF
jgi:hypothetical protein